MCLCGGGGGCLGFCGANAGWAVPRQSAPGRSTAAGQRARIRTSTARRRSYCTVTSLLAPSATPATMECSERDRPAAATPTVALEQQPQRRQRLRQDWRGAVTAKHAAVFGTPSSARSDRDADVRGSADADAPGMDSGAEAISADTAALMTRLAALSTTRTNRNPTPKVNAARGNSLKMNMQDQIGPIRALSSRILNSRHLVQCFVPHCVVE